MPGVSTERDTFFREVKEITEKNLNEFSLKLVEWLILGIADGIAEHILLSFSSILKYSN